MTIVRYPDGQSRDVVAPHALLAARNGDYLAIGHPNASNYHGWFIHRDGRYYKIAYDVTPLSAVDEVAVGDHIERRCTEGAVQRFHIDEDGVLIEMSGACRLTLDCKQLYDESDQGRAYDIKIRPAAKGAGASMANVTAVDITYRKYADGAMRDLAYTLHVSILTTCRVREERAWREVAYPYDARRGTHATRWVHDALVFEGTGRIAMSAGTRRMASQSFARLMRVRVDTPALTDEDLALASLRALTTRDGIIAGLPWFFQRWSRDELISLGGHIATGALDVACDAIDTWTGCVSAHGLPAIHPDRGLRSADAPGWLGRRITDVLAHASSPGISRERLLRWRAAVDTLVRGTHLRDALVWTACNETWMDTAWHDDGRPGARIEIQAGFIALCRARAQLCLALGEPAPDDPSITTRAAIHARLWDGRLIDGLHPDGTPDRTRRPNVVLAWYLVPDLCTPAQWHATFTDAVQQLWRPWGGLTSIAQDHPLYSPHYTGEDVRSYHRGDSWYYVNNIAAMAFWDDPLLRAHAVQILAASVHDLRWQGFAGHASEVSSAATQDASGCWAQAWSAATLVEALRRCR